MSIDSEHKKAEGKYSEACLYYVAATRAEQQLFLSTWTQSHESSVPLPFLGQIVEALGRTNDVTFLQPKVAAWSLPKPIFALTPFEEETIPYPMIRQHEYCPSPRQIRLLLQPTNRKRRVSALQATAG